MKDLLFRAAALVRTRLSGVDQDSNNDPSGKTVAGNRQAHLHLLHLFLTPRSIVSITASGWCGHWTTALGEDPDIAISRFMKQGLIAPASVEQALMAASSVDQLKQHLRERALRTTGRKPELIARLIEADPNGSTQLANGYHLLVCCGAGLKMATDYANDRQNRLSRTSSEATTALEQGRLEQAIQHVAEFNHEYFMTPGLGLSDETARLLHQDLIAKIFANPLPEILGTLPDRTAHTLRVAASLNIMGLTKAANSIGRSVPRSDLKHDHDTSVRMVMFAASHARRLDQFRDAGVAAARIKGMQDGCTACKALAERRYSTRSLPSLPYARCTCEAGCRCIALAEIDDNI